MFLHAVGICLPNYTVSNIKRRKTDIHRLERFSRHPIITPRIRHLGRQVSPFLQTMEALRESRGTALLCFRPM
jgi:hypothetical protein